MFLAVISGNKKRSLFDFSAQYFLFKYYISYYQYKTQIIAFQPHLNRLQVNPNFSKQEHYINMTTLCGIILNYQPQFRKSKVIEGSAKTFCLFCIATLSMTFLFHQIYVEHRFFVHFFTHSSFQELNISLTLVATSVKTLLANSSIEQFRNTLFKKTAISGMIHC